jgi:hypothetical protein
MDVVAFFLLWSRTTVMKRYLSVMMEPTPLQMGSVLFAMETEITVLQRVCFGVQFEQRL